MARWCTWLAGLMLVLAAGGLLIMHGFGLHGAEVGAVARAHDVEHSTTSAGAESANVHGIVAEHGTTDSDVRDTSGGTAPGTPHHAGALGAVAACVAILVTAFVALLPRLARRLQATVEVLRMDATELRIRLGCSTSPPRPERRLLCIWLC